MDGWVGLSRGSRGRCWSFDVSPFPTRPIEPGNNSDWTCGGYYQTVRDWRESHGSQAVKAS